MKGSGKKGDVKNKGADHTSQIVQGSAKKREVQRKEVDDGNVRGAGKKGEMKSKEVIVEPKWREEFMVLGKKMGKMRMWN